MISFLRHCTVYWLRFQTNANTDELLEHAFPTLPWEEWHRRYGHISYAGLQSLRDKNLINRFNPDPKSPKQDCSPCTAAKMHYKAFSPTATWTGAIGHLTHMDLWGRYPVQSINRNQYYILMINDKSRYTTIQFLKQKSQATQHVQNYITHLNVRRHNTHTICIDRGTKFINDALKTWCAEHGIEIQTTAPYSPSQNRVAERMNRTIVELVRAMINAQNLPGFLWEPAVAHAAYVQNRSYT